MPDTSIFMRIKKRVGGDIVLGSATSSGSLPDVDTGDFVKGYLDWITVNTVSVKVGREREESAEEPTATATPTAGVAPAQATGTGGAARATGPDPQRQAQRQQRRAGAANARRARNRDNPRAGQPNFTITKISDLATCKLMQLVKEKDDPETSAGAIEKLVIDVCAPLGAGLDPANPTQYVAGMMVPYVRYRLDNCTLHSYSISCSDDGEPEETLEICCEHLWMYFWSLSHREGGRKGAPIIAEYVFNPQT
jgi:hypothetical protein